MEIKSVRECIYKQDGEFSLLYEELKKINYSFVELVDLKKQNSLVYFEKNIPESLGDKEKQEIKKFLSKLLNIVYSDIKEIHKKLYC